MELNSQQLFRQQCYINGQWITAANGESFNVFNPFDQSLLGDVPNCSSKEAEQAIIAAHAAWSAWRQLTAEKRASLLMRWASLIREHQEDLAILLSTEQGKALAEARGEIAYATSFIDWYAAEALRIYGDTIPANVVQKRCIIQKEPIGVVAAITPWNFPCAMITRKCAPALAAGCTVVLKPAEDTPFSALALAHLAEEAGFPAGVLNVITGDAAAIGKSLSTHPLVRKLSFTGSTRVGKLLMQQSASTLKKLSLELGGNAPFIVCADADLDQAVDGLMQSKFRNSGQTCISPNRILVDDSIYDVFAEKLSAQMDTLRVGDGLAQGINQGPLINQVGFDKVAHLVDQAVSEGAKLRIGGNAHPAAKLCYQPTLLTEVMPEMCISQTEIFGPVVAMMRFQDIQQAIDMANDTEYGLAAYFYAQNSQNIWYIAENLAAGMISINNPSFSNATTPFGGIKASGFGREGSKYGLEEFLQIKYLCWDVGLPSS